MQWQFLNIKPATISKQTSDEMARQPEDKKFLGKIVILSLNSNFEVVFKAVSEGYQKAKREGLVNLNFKVEFWFRGKIYILH